MSPSVTLLDQPAGTLEEWKLVVLYSTQLCLKSTIFVHTCKLIMYYVFCTCICIGLLQEDNDDDDDDMYLLKMFNKHVAPSLLPRPPPVPSPEFAAHRLDKC